MGKALKIEIGQIFDKLMVMGMESQRKGHRMCKCQCVCGKFTIIRVSALLNGNTCSCGCLIEELRSKMVKSRAIPGVKDNNGSITVEYNTWRKIKGRCNNPKDAKFKDYGGRGIKVSAQWLNSFPQFLKDMGKRPADCNSIDRIDVNGNYEPNNCRWANPKTQSSNRRVNIYFELSGERITQAELARRLGINPKSVEYFRKRGKNAEEIIQIYQNKRHAA